MSAAIGDVAPEDRRYLVDWIGERPETVIPVAALIAGEGRLWIDGPRREPRAVLVESPLVPGEPQGFGDAEALLRLLAVADGWTCVETTADLASEISVQFTRRWGRARIVIDVVHELTTSVVAHDHPLVRCLTPTEAMELPTSTDDILPDRRLVAAAADQGRLYVAVEGGLIVGQGGSLASGLVFADVGVHVAPSHRGQGVATACAASACEALQRDGLIPVWGTGSDNAASLAVAMKLGFREVARLTFLVPDSPDH